MPLRTYTKNTAYAAANLAVRPLIVAPVQEMYWQPITPTTRRTTIWTILGGMYNWVRDLTTHSSWAGIFVPLLFLFTGGLFIYLQFQPSIVKEVKTVMGYFDQGTASVVQDNYLAERLRYVSNPSFNYFEKISEEAIASGLLNDPELLGFSQTMYLTVPALGFNRLPIKSNVESSTSTVYNQVLNTQLAHFKGTSLPFAKNNGNIVIYGHSAGGAYNPRPDDVLAAFSFLSDLKVGDEIMLEVSGQTYKYRMSKSKIVTPDDFSIVHGTPGRETLTLLTCHPPGNNSHRYVVIATPIN